MLGTHLRLPGRDPGLAPLFALTALLAAGCGGRDEGAESSTTSEGAPAASEGLRGEGESGAHATRSWARDEAPQIVLSVVIEALDAETLERLLPALPEGGFIRRAMRDGAYYPRAELPFAATYSAPAYATLYTGATPRVTGVVADALRDEAPGLTPLRVRTVADSLADASAGTAKVVALALETRAALPGVGAALTQGWAHHVTHGRFATLREGWPTPALEGAADHDSDNDVAPHAAPAPDEHASTARYLAPWLPHDAAHLAHFAGSDLAEGELDWQGLGVVFPRDPSRAPTPALALHATPRSTEALLALAARQIQAARLGQDDIPDLLAIGIGATGVAARLYGVHSWEYLDNLIAADLLLAELVDMLMERGPVAVLLTSDRGVMDLPERHRDHQRVDPAALRRALDDGLDVMLERRIAWVESIIPPYVYLTRGAPFRVDEAVTAAIRFLEGRPEILRAYAVGGIPAASEGTDALDDLVRESIAPGVGGEIYIVPREGHVFDTSPARGGGTDGGGVSAREREVPILLVGAGVIAGESEARVDVRRYAPTLAALLGVPRPPASRLPPLRAVRPSRPSVLPGRLGP